MRASDYVVTAQAIDDGMTLGVGGEVISRLQRMAAASAPVTHASGNRRFENYVLKIDGDRIEGVAPYMKKTG